MNNYLPAFHSSSAHNFVAIFKDEAPRLGVRSPVYMFYGKPSFFSQFSKKLNSMAIAVSLDKTKEMDWHPFDSGLDKWPEDLREKLLEHIGEYSDGFRGNLANIDSYVQRVFGCNLNYFVGQTVALDNIDEPVENPELLKKIIGFFRYLETCSYEKGPLEKSRTVEMKTEPIALNKDNAVLFLVVPNTHGASLEADENSVTSGERDTAQKLSEAANLANELGLEVQSCLDQRPRFNEIDSLYQQLFGMIRERCYTIAEGEI